MQHFKKIAYKDLALWRDMTKTEGRFPPIVYQSGRLHRFGILDITPLLGE